MGFAKKFQGSLCLIVLPLFFLCQLSCAYKFSLLARKEFGRYKSIYLAESINYTGSHLPIEVFETEMERGFIHYFPDLVLSLTEKADLYLRIKFHTLGGEVSSLDLVSSSDHLKINELKDEEGNLRYPDSYEDMRTGKYGALKETLSIRVEMELWDLKRREKIFRKVYSKSGEYSLAFAPEKRLLEMEKNRETKFQEFSKEIIHAAMIDLMGVF